MLFRGLCQAICYLFKKLRQQRNFRHAITGFPAKWCLRTDRRNSILMTSCWWRVTTHANLVSVSNCSCLLGYLLQPIRLKHFPDLGSNTSSVWNLFARFSDVICRLSFHSASIVSLLKTMFRHWDCFLSSRFPATLVLVHARALLGIEKTSPL